MGRERTQRWFFAASPSNFVHSSMTYGPKSLGSLGNVWAGAEEESWKVSQGHWAGLHSGGRLRSWKGSQKETWLLEAVYKIVPGAFPITDPDTLIYLFSHQEPLEEKK